METDLFQSRFDLMLVKVETSTVTLPLTTKRNEYEYLMPLSFSFQVSRIHCATSKLPT